jgi:rhodanese-related sulfurtransferase
VQILDVREHGEWEAGHIPGSVHVPYHELRDWPDELDAERPIAAICSSGQRAAVAASLLLRARARDVIHVVEGGVGTWERAGFGVTRPEPSAAAPPGGR